MLERFTYGILVHQLVTLRKIEIIPYSYLKNVFARSDEIAIKFFSDWWQSSKYENNIKSTSLSIKKVFGHNYFEYRNITPQPKPKHSTKDYFAYQSFAKDAFLTLTNDYSEVIGSFVLNRGDKGSKADELGKYKYVNALLENTLSFTFSDKVFLPKFEYVIASTGGTPYKQYKHNGAILPAKHLSLIIYESAKSFYDKMAMLRRNPIYERKIGFSQRLNATDFQSNPVEITVDNNKLFDDIEYALRLNPGSQVRFRPLYVKIPTKMKNATSMMFVESNFLSQPYDYVNEKQIKIISSINLNEIEDWEGRKKENNYITVTLQPGIDWSKGAGLANDIQLDNVRELKNFKLSYLDEKLNLIDFDDKKKQPFLFASVYLAKST